MLILRSTIYVYMIFDVLVCCGILTFTMVPVMFLILMLVFLIYRLIVLDYVAVVASARVD